MRPTSYVTRIPGRVAWAKIMEEYRRNGPTLGARPSGDCASERAVTEGPITGAPGE
jgi:hypothetical protein